MTKPADCGLCLCEPIEIGPEAKSYQGKALCALCRNVMQQAERKTGRSMLFEPTPEQREVCA